MSDKIFNNLSFEILKEDKVGILGKSGVGKSTLLDILMALIQSDKGEVLIDEVNVKNVKNSWQKIIGCVPQNVF